MNFVRDVLMSSQKQEPNFSVLGRKKRGRKRVEFVLSFIKERKKIQDSLLKGDLELMDYSFFLPSVRNKT